MLAMLAMLVGIVINAMGVSNYTRALLWDRNGQPPATFDEAFGNHDLKVLAAEIIQLKRDHDNDYAIHEQKKIDAAARLENMKVVAIQDLDKGSEEKIELKQKEQEEDQQHVEAIPIVTTALSGDKEGSNL